MESVKGEEDGWMWEELGRGPGSEYEQNTLDKILKELIKY